MVPWSGKNIRLTKMHKEMRTITEWWCENCQSWSECQGPCTNGPPMNSITSRTREQEVEVLTFEEAVERGLVPKKAVEYVRANGAEHDVSFSTLGSSSDGRSPED